MNEAELSTLSAIRQRILWLSTYMLHHANKIRPNPDGSKIGGHQASSASMITLATVLLFKFLKSTDRFQFKPHGSPAYHAAMYVMGCLPRSYMTGLREFGRLQSYFSRSKEVVPVDFSTGSMGLGCAAPLYAATAQQYAQHHFGNTTANRFVTISGDAELDEGNVWETLLEEGVRGVNNVLWIIDLNRQSLDRVVPGIRALRLKAMFEACGWDVMEAKYGSQLEAKFAQPGGSALRIWIDDMPNEAYQALIRSDGGAIRAAALRTEDDELIGLLADIPDDQLPPLLGNLGGTDLSTLTGSLNEAARRLEIGSRPVALFAYTIKGWGLPIAGDPFNHSALMSDDLMEQFRMAEKVSPENLWPKFEQGSPEWRACEAARDRLGFRRFDDDSFVAPTGYGQTGRTGSIRDLPLQLADIPVELNANPQMSTSTQEAFGRTVMKLADLPALAPRIITTSADVATSTNLGGWINKTGVFSFESPPDYEAGRPRPINWRPAPKGQHIELGIAEMNLFSLLGQLGLSHELCGQLLLPIGTLYDPFVCRGLDALIYGLYSESKFIFAATPSGTTLSPEGGAHQSSVTVSLGMELPNLNYHEPCFALEVEWALMDGLRSCMDRNHGRSTYLRLTTKAVDQSLMKAALDRLGRDDLRRQCLAGGYRLRLPAADLVHQHAPLLHLVTCGAMIPETLQAADYLEREGIACNVINMTSPRAAYEGWQHARTHAGSHILDELILESQRNAPILTVHDAASHALAWVGSAFGQPTTSLGVDKFGQSGNRADVYKYVGIDVENILKAGFEAIDAQA